MNEIVIGSRGSDLALWQAHFTQKQLEQLGYSVRIEIIKTQGDQIQHLSFDKMEGKGFFTKELEDALLNGSIDLAVHSHKDLPTTSPPGLVIAGVSYREDCSETLLIQSDKVLHTEVFQLLPNAHVGTSSHRRKAQLHFYRPDLRISDLRGNVPTRIQKLRDGKYDAIMLATAGIKRLQLDLSDLHQIQLLPHKFVPAPAQGVLAYQIRENDSRMQQIIEQINTPAVQQAIAAERLILNKLDGGCLLPLGAYCEARNHDYRLWVSLQTDTGMRRLFIQGKNPLLMAQKALIQLTAPQVGTVFISREPEDAKLFISLVGAAGYAVEAHNPVCYETIQLKALPEFDWIFFSSIRAVDHFLAQHTIPETSKIGVLGSGTAAALGHHGYSANFTGSDGNTRQTAAEFAECVAGQTVFFPVASDGLRSIQREVESTALVVEHPVYRTVANPNFFPPKANILVFTSPSCVHAFAASGGQFGAKIIAIGRSTADALTACGALKVFEPPFTTEESLADMVCGL